MKLTDFDNREYAKQALKENYKMNLPLDRLSLIDTKNMLKKVRTLANEAKNSGEHYDTHSQSYMKLVFMEEALVNHYNTIVKNTPKIVFEDEAVEEAQVTLAAQDMIDSIRKMIEQVSDMLVKELPALTDSIESEIGVNESQQFNEQASKALTDLQSALNQCETSLKGARGVVTGTGAQGFDTGITEPAGELDMEVGAEEPLPAGGEEVADMDIQEPVEPVEPVEPETSPLGGAGRAKR